MSRIRTIKPELWTSEQVVSCSPFARLLFIGLFNFCDDNGVHPASYIRLKAEVFPADNFEISEVKQWINELIQNELIREYVAEDKAYWIVTGWRKHQRIDRPTYRHPLPNSDLNKLPDNSTTIRREVADTTSTFQQLIDDLSTTEWNGKEWKGKEKDICEVETSPVAYSASNSSASTLEIFKHWQNVMGHPRAKLDSKRKRVIEQALKLGYSVTDLKQAIDGCLLTPFNMGQNDRKQVYDDLGLILRDSAHVESFMNNASGGVVAVSESSDQLMIGVI